MEVDSPLLLAVGAAVLTLCVVEVVWTTVSVAAGRGPLTQLVARFVWLAGSAGSAGHRRLQVVGVLAAVAVPVSWLVLLLAGFSIMFMADREAVVVAATQQPVGWLGRVAYAVGGAAGAGASLVAGTPAWELVNNVAAVAGLLLVTMSLTYLLQTVNAVSSERSTLSTVSGLGPSPAAAVATALRSKGAGTLPVQLVAVAQGLSLAAQHHLALPAQQFFHSGDPATSAAVNVARFDEILTVLEHATPGLAAPTVRTGRSAVDAFMATIEVVDEGVDVPPLPSLDELRDVTGELDGERFTASLEQLADRRRRLHAFVRQEGWSWEDVAGADDPSRA